MAHLQLFWPKDSNGYRLEKTPPGPGRADVDARTWVVANQGEPLPMEDRFMIPGLYRRLAELGTARTRRPRPANAKGALDFVESYGFLGEDLQDGRESVDFIARCIRVARELVRAIDRKEWIEIQRWTFLNAKGIRLYPEFRYLGDDRSELFFGPNRLIDAIWLQALQDVANATQFEKCDRPGCPEWFAVGPGTGRARIRRPGGARYCSPKCQRAHAYMRKKGISK